jgi:hypothetical protein
MHTRTGAPPLSFGGSREITSEDNNPNNPRFVPSLTMLWPHQVVNDIEGGRKNTAEKWCFTEDVTVKVTTRAGMSICESTNLIYASSFAIY